eukprot:955182-Rhodomonas_salina.1
MHSTPVLPTPKHIKPQTKARDARCSRDMSGLGHVMMVSQMLGETLKAEKALAKLQQQIASR